MGEQASAGWYPDGSDVASTEPIDLLGMIVNAILRLPAQFVASYQANSEQWNLVGLMVIGLLALGWLAKRSGRRGRAQSSVPNRAMPDSPAVAITRQPPLHVESPAG